MWARSRRGSEVTDVSPPLISFRWTYHFEADDAVLTSDSTLRFRDKDEIEAALAQTGFDVLDVRDAPGPPGPGVRLRLYSPNFLIQALAAFFWSAVTAFIVNSFLYAATACLRLPSRRYERAR